MKVLFVSWPLCVGGGMNFVAVARDNVNLIEMILSVDIVSLLLVYLQALCRVMRSTTELIYIEYIYSQLSDKIHYLGNPHPLGT